MVCDRKMWERWFAGNRDVCFHLGCLPSQARVLWLLQLHGEQCWEKTSLYRAQGESLNQALGPQWPGGSVGWHSPTCRSLPRNQIIWFSLAACPSFLPGHGVWVSFRQHRLRVYKVKRICSRYLLWRKGPYKELKIFNTKKIIGIWQRHLKW